MTTAYKHIRKKTPEEKRETLKQLENKSTREVQKLFLKPMPPIQVKKTEYQDKVLLRLELSHEQNNKLEKLRALKSHGQSLESLLANLIEKELRAFENTQFKPSRSKNPRQISKRLRNFVLQRSNYLCQYPGCNSNRFLQIDHIIPVRAGGNQKPNNLQILCANHNQMKG